LDLRKMNSLLGVAGECLAGRTLNPYLIEGARHS